MFASLKGKTLNPSQDANTENIGPTVTAEEFDFYSAFWYIHDHPNLNAPNVEVFVTKVNPETDSIDDDQKLNTKVAVWVELFTLHPNDRAWTHLVSYDTGGSTFEEAIINLANLYRGGTAPKKS